MLEKWIWDDLGVHLGRDWDVLGRLLVALGRFLAVLGAFKIELFSSMGPRWAPRGPLGSIWGRFGSLMGSIWPQFGAYLKVIWGSGALLGQAGAKSH